mgnify:FL=1
MKGESSTTGRLGWSILAAVLAVTGCMTVGPDYLTPETPVPVSWSYGEGVATNAAAPTVSDAVDQAAGLCRWWSVFCDPVLTDLVERARLDNLDVRQAEARLRQARAQRALAVADRLPTVAANGSASRSRGSEETGGGKTSTMYANSLDASWELDLFGGKKREIESAEASLAASQASRSDVLVSLVAEVALNYVAYRSYQMRLEITETNLAAQAEMYEITRWRQEANLVTQLDVDQARMSLEQTRASLPALRTGMVQAEHQIATLLGQAPGASNVLLGGRRSVPVAAERIAVGVPADLLRRRPDVRQAERKLAAQTAQIGVAEAARYPDFTLSGSVGLEALSAGNLYTAGARAAQGAVKAGWALFDGGRIRQKVAVQTALQEEALGAYEAAVLAALKDVEDALVAYANEQDRRRALHEAAAAGASAFQLARDKYASGLIDFQTVLDTQQSLLTVQNTLAYSEAEVTSDLIRLYKALGGGWDPSEEVTH